MPVRPVGDDSVPLSGYPLIFLCSFPQSDLLVSPFDFLPFVWSLFPPFPFFPLPLRLGDCPPAVASFKMLLFRALLRGEFPHFYVAHLPRSVFVAVIFHNQLVCLRHQRSLGSCLIHMSYALSFQVSGYHPMKHALA